MVKKVLLLGARGKIGTAIMDQFKGDYSIVGKNSADFDAYDFENVRIMVREESPDILINTVAFLGIDPCENESGKAFRLNTLFPKLLADLSAEMGFTLVHFSTDAVFNDREDGYYNEMDKPSPLNIYGVTKYGGDCMVSATASDYYIFRISVQFGESSKNSQFVEKMLQKIKGGETILKISSDIISSPTYSKDVAREVKRIIDQSLPFGLYHIANRGKGTLYDLMVEIVKTLELDVEVQKVSYKDFKYVGRKNISTPIESKKIDSLRPWQEAVKEYCKGIR